MKLKHMALPLAALALLAGWLFSLGTGSMWPGLPRHFAMPVRIVFEGAAGAVAFALAFALPSAWALIARATRRKATTQPPNHLTT